MVCTREHHRDAPPFHSASAYRPDICPQGLVVMLDFYYKMDRRGDEDGIPPE